MFVAVEGLTLIGEPLELGSKTRVCSLQNIQGLGFRGLGFRVRGLATERWGRCSPESKCSNSIVLGTKNHSEASIWDPKPYLEALLT